MCHNCNINSIEKLNILPIAVRHLYYPKKYIQQSDYNNNNRCEFKWLGLIKLNEM